MKYDIFAKGTSNRVIIKKGSFTPIKTILLINELVYVSVFEDKVRQWKLIVYKISSLIETSDIKGIKYTFSDGST